MTVLQTTAQVLELFELMCPLRRTSYANTMYTLTSPPLGEPGNLVVVEGVRFPVDAPEGSDLHYLLTSLSTEHTPEGNISLVMTALTDLANQESLGSLKYLPVV